MQKKLLAVAVASVLGAPAVAVAQSSTVQIFGTVYIEYGSGRQGIAGGAPLNNRQNIDVLGNPGSEIGFKGEEKLGGGLSAWFQCISTMDYREGSAPSTNAAGAINTAGNGDGLFCTRNSALGLKGGFGNLFVGRWDTPFKRTISPTNVGGNDTGIWGTAFLLTGGSTSTVAASSRSVFKRREGNSIFYDSPNFGGFQVMGHMSSGQASTANPTLGTAATTGVTSSKPRTWGIAGQYSAGPLYVSAAYERHDQFAAVGGENQDSGWHAGANYRWGPVLFGGQYTEQKFESSGGTTVAAALGVPAGSGFGASNAKYRNFTFGVDWNIAGPHGLRAAYTVARDATGNATVLGTPGPTATNLLIGVRPAPCYGATFATRVCNNTGASMFQIRYVYAFSKRTEFNLGYSKTKNDTNASYVPNILSTPNNGQSTTFYALSLRHTF